MNRHFPLIMTALAVVLACYMVNQFMETGRQAKALARDLRTEVLDPIKNSVDLVDLRDQVIRFMLSRGVDPDREYTEVALWPPDKMTPETEKEAQEAGINAVRVLNVSIRFDAGDGYKRRTFTMRIQRPFAQDRVPKLTSSARSKR